MFTASNAYSIRYAYSINKRDTLDYAATPTLCYWRCVWIFNFGYLLFPFCSSRRFGRQIVKYSRYTWNSLDALRHFVNNLTNKHSHKTFNSCQRNSLVTACHVTYSHVRRAASLSSFELHRHDYAYKCHDKRRSTQNHSTHSFGWLPTNSKFINTTRIQLLHAPVASTESAGPSQMFTRHHSELTIWIVHLNNENW
jgi:hypothetical protein